MEIINKPSNSMELTLGEMGKSGFLTKNAYSLSLFFLLFSWPIERQIILENIQPSQTSSEGEEPALTCRQKRFET